MVQEGTKKTSEGRFFSVIFPVMARIALGAAFFIAGFNFSNTAFFDENPLFGVSFLAEILISTVAFAFGAHTVPILVMMAKKWAEKLIQVVVTNIVQDFWEQQSKRMQDSRRQRQKRAKKDKEKKRKERFSGGVVLDTSVLVDGRIVDIAKTNFVDTSYIVPQAVIDELHLISDNEDSIKRQRGRRGLDCLNKLKKHTKVDIYNPEKGSSLFNQGVDKGLVNFSKKYKTRLMTLDFNLIKVAGVAGVKTINLNELSEALKAAVLPGENLEVKVVQKGKEKKQGLGYLPDGTMLVIDNAKDMVGDTVNVEVTKLIQTPAGRMVFCKLAD